jgi:hypothetical protein
VGACDFAVHPKFTLESSSQSVLHGPPRSGRRLLPTKSDETTAVAAPDKLTAACWKSSEVALHDIPTFVVRKTAIFRCA